MQQIELNNGVKMPAIGLGTYSLKGNVLLNSLKAGLVSSDGFLLIDAAHGYDNEPYVGEVLSKIYQEGEFKRNNVFLTSKIGDELEDGFPIGKFFYNTKACLNHDTKSVVLYQFDRILNDLRTDYIDLLLIHWPYNDALEDIWESMVNLYNNGRVNAIGVSNCRPRHIERIIKSSSFIPQVNQIYISPFNTQIATKEYCVEHGIALEAYSPLHGLTDKKIAKSFEIQAMCEKYNKSIPQIILRWNYQNGVISIPRSTRPCRVSSNMNIFDFSLSVREMKFIDSFNKDYQLLPESKYCPGY